MHIQGDKIINPLCLLHGVGDALGQLRSQCLHIGGKGDVGQLLGGVKIRLHRVGLHFQRGSVVCSAAVAVLCPKAAVLGKVCLPVCGALGCSFRRNISGLGGKAVQRDIALCRAGSGQRQPYLDVHGVSALSLCGSKGMGKHLVRHADAGAQGNVCADCTGAHHLVVLGLKTIPTALRDGCVQLAGSKVGMGSHQRFGGAVDIALLPFHKTPVHLTGSIQCGELLGGKVPQGGLQLVQQLLGGEGVVLRQTAQNLPVRQQTLPPCVHTVRSGVYRQRALRVQGLVLAGSPVLGQTGVDAGNGGIVVACLLQAADVVRQLHIQVCKTSILIHHALLLFIYGQAAVCCSQKATASVSQPSASVLSPTPMQWGADSNTFTT